MPTHAGTETALVPPRCRRIVERGSCRKARAPLERTANGQEIDWDRPETLRQGSGPIFMLWLLVPLLCCLAYGYFTRRAGGGSG